MIELIVNNFYNIKNKLYYKTLEKILYNLKKTNNIKKNKNHKITVYTPTKNRSDILISRAVKGVLNQSYKNFEYIIVGDYCVDDTKKKILEINDPRIKFYDLRDENITYKKLNDISLIWKRGGSIPSNFALRKAQGTWIARCDDDEEWKNDFLKKSLDFAINNDYEFVSSKSIYSKNDDANQEGTSHYLYDDYFCTKKYQKGLYNCKIGAPSTWLMRSYLKLFKFDPDCWRKKWNAVNDAEMIERFAYCGVNCGYLEEALSYQYPRPGNNSTGSKGMLNDYKKFQV